MKLAEVRERQDRIDTEQVDIMEDTDGSKEEDLGKSATQDEEPATKIGSNLTAELKKFLQTGMEETALPEIIRRGTDLATILDRKISWMETRADREFAAPIANVGKLALLMKAALKKDRKDFTGWASKAFRNLGLRSVQGYMKVAKIPGVDFWIFLGKNRLMKIAPLLVGLNGDPIADLFAGLGVTMEAAVGMKREALAATWTQVMVTAERKRKSLALAKKVVALAKSLEADFGDGGEIPPEDFASIEGLIAALQTMIAKVRD